MKAKYGYRDLRELLAESLETSKYISIEEFKKRLRKFKYQFYAFDDRVNQIMFIINDIPGHLDQPTWLFIEIIN